MRRINELFLKIAKVLTEENTSRKELSTLFEELWYRSDRRMQKLNYEVKELEACNARFSLENLKDQYVNLEPSSKYLNGRIRNEIYLNFMEFYYQVSSLEQKYQDAKLEKLLLG